MQCNNLWQESFPFLLSNQRAPCDLRNPQMPKTSPSKLLCQEVLAKRSPLPISFILFSLLILSSWSSLYLPVSTECWTQETLFPWASCICSFDCRSDFFERVVGYFLDTQRAQSTSLEESQGGQLIYHCTLSQSLFCTWGRGEIKSAQQFLTHECILFLLASTSLSDWWVFV